MSIQKIIKIVVACAVSIGSAYAASMSPEEWETSCSPSNDVLRIHETMEGFVGLNLNEDVATDYGAYFTVESGSQLSKFTATGLPTGVKLNSKTFALSGKPTKKGIYHAVISAVNKNKFEHSRVIKFNVGGIQEPDEIDELALKDRFYGISTASPVDYYLLFDACNWKDTNTKSSCNTTFNISGLPAGVKMVTEKYGPYVEDGYSENWIYYFLDGAPAKPGLYTVSAKYTEKFVDGGTTTTDNYESKFSVVVQGGESRYIDVKVAEGEGVVSGSGVIAAGKTVKTVAKAEKDWTFAGWYADKECEVPYYNNYHYRLGKTGDFRIAEQTWVNVNNVNYEGYFPSELYARFVKKSDDTGIGISYFSSDNWGWLEGAVLEIDPNAGYAYAYVQAQTVTTDEKEGSYTSITAVKGLPACVSVEKEFGEISGFYFDDKKNIVPGAYDVTMTAKNASGVTTNVTFRYVIGNLESDLIAFDNDESDFVATIDTEVSWEVSAAEEGYSLTVTGLPAGLKYNAKEGVISGKPTKAGEFLVTFTAKKGSEKGVATRKFVVTDNLVVETEDAVYMPDINGNFSLDEVFTKLEADSAATFTFKGLPAGVKYVAADFVLTGVAKSAGKYEIEATVKNKSNICKAKFVLTVPNSDKIYVSNLDDDDNIVVTAGVPVGDGDIVVATDDDWTLSASGLPAGLKFNAKAGEIEGKTTAKEGIYKVVITTKKGAESETYAFTIQVAYPTVTVEGLYSDVEGEEITDKVAGAGKYAYGSKVTLRATANKGNFFIGWDTEDLSKEDYKVSGTTMTFNMPAGDVSVRAIFATSAADVLTIRADELPEYVLDDDDMFKVCLTNDDVIASAISPLKVALSALPAGLKYDAKTFTVSGKSSKPGVYPVEIKASNSSTNEVALWTLVVPNSEAFEGFEDVQTSFVRKVIGVNSAGTEINLNNDYSGWRVTVSGLPAGLKYDRKQGVITGIPAKAGLYAVTLTARMGNRVETSIVYIDVAPFPEWLVGTYNGIEFGDEGEANVVALSIAKDGKATVTVKEAKSGKIITEKYVSNLAPTSVEEDGAFQYFIDEDGDSLSLNVVPVLHADGNSIYGIASYVAIDKEGWVGEGFATQELYTRKPAVEGLLNLAGKSITLDQDALAAIGVEDAKSLVLKFGQNGAVAPTFKWLFEDKVKNGVAFATPVNVDNTTYVAVHEYLKGTVDYECMLAITLGENATIENIEIIDSIPYGDE